MKGFDRRSLLAWASTAGAAALAGCQALDGLASTDDSGGSSGGGDDAGTTEPDETTNGREDAGERGGTAGQSLYEDWLPAPESAPYFAYAGDAQAVAAADLPDEATTRVQEILLPVPERVLSIPEVGAFATGTAGGGVCTFEVPRATLRDRLAGAASDDAAAASPPDGYEAFATRRRTYWLGPDHLLAGREASFLERMAATQAGEGSTYALLLTNLVRRLPTGSLLAASRASTATFEDDTGIAHVWDFTGDAVTLDMVVEFEDADAAAALDVDAATNDWPLGAYDVSQARVDGQFAHFTGTIPTAEFDLLAREETTTAATTVAPPEASFGMEFDPGSDDEWDGDDDERITITHEGGDAIPLDETVLVYGSRPVPQLESIASTPPGGDAWRAGETWTLSNATAEPAFDIGTTVFVIWIGPDGNASHVLARDIVTAR